MPNPLNGTKASDPSSGFGRQGPEFHAEASLPADKRTTNRQEADSDERAMRVRPKGHAQDARDQLRSE